MSSGAGLAISRKSVFIHDARFRQILSRPDERGCERDGTAVVRPSSGMPRNDTRSMSTISEKRTTDPEPRTRRAIEEKMDALFVGVGTYVVHSE